MAEAPLSAGRLWRRSMLKYWPHYVVGGVALLLANISEVLVPKFIQWSIDVVGGRAAPAFVAGESGLSGAPALRLLAAWLCVALLAGFIGRIFWRQFLARRTHVAGRDLKVRMWRVLSFLPLRTLRGYPMGDLMNRAIGDWNASRAIHGFTLVLTLDICFMTTLAVACMVSIDPVLTLYCLAIFPFLPRLIVRLAKLEKRQHAAAQVQLGELSDRIAQSLSSVRLTRATGSEAQWQTRLTADATEYAARRFAVVRTAWRIFPLGAVPTLIAYGILLVLGVQKIRSGALSVGQFVALQSYVLMLQASLMDLGDCIGEWQRGFASLTRLAEIFNLQGIADRLRSRRLDPPVSTVGVELRLSRMTFSYDTEDVGKTDVLDSAPSSRPALDSVTLHVRPGEAVGIFGPIGAGKSTLLALAAGLIDPPSGTLTLDGADASTMSRDWFAANAALVPQRSFLFAGTIRGNLELDEKLADDVLWDVLRLVRLEGDVRAFPGGLDARIGEWGLNLSGGQKQRLALARALLRRRRLYLLDDCLSAVDAATEAAILEGLRLRIGSATLIQVAHRRSTLKSCDRLLILDRGRLTAGDGLLPAQSGASV
jgi:ATP-binding cassette subfamily B multidrug efflux pump